MYTGREIDLKTSHSAIYFKTVLRRIGNTNSSKLGSTYELVLSILLDKKNVSDLWCIYIMILASNTL